MVKLSIANRGKAHMKEKNLFFTPHALFSIIFSMLLAAIPTAALAENLQCRAEVIGDTTHLMQSDPSHPEIPAKQLDSKKTIVYQKSGNLMFKDTAAAQGCQLNYNRQTLNSLQKQAMNMTDKNQGEGICSPLCGDINGISLWSGVAECDVNSHACSCSCFQL